jgi:LemA protein
MSTLLLIILVALVMVILWLVGVYNGLIKLNNRTKEAWSDIDVQLKRRHDLIPNLVETVKGYASHESGLFQKVTEARTAAMGAQTKEEIAATENNLMGTLKSLFAVAENYPDLKANTNFLSLQAELSETENKIEASRRFYNGNVRDFNTKIEVFPTNLVAGMLKFTKYEFFGVNEEEKKNVEVKF